MEKERDPISHHRLRQKFTAPPGSSARCKMGIVADACVDIELVHVAKAPEMYPHVINHLWV